MSTKKNENRKFFESLRGGPLTFGKMIESLRKADEISQVDLARKLKMSRAHLCDIEKGRRAVSVEKAAEFASVMGYSVAQFVAVSIEDQLREAGLKAKVKIEVA